MMHLYEEMAAEAPTARKRPILMMGRLEIRLNEILKELSFHYEAVVNPRDPSSIGWQYFEVIVGTDHLEHICTFKFEFPTSPHTENNVVWQRRADRAEAIVTTAIKGDLEWCKDADKVRQQRRSEEDRLKREGSERDGGGKG